MTLDDIFKTARNKIGGLASGFNTAKTNLATGLSNVGATARNIGREFKQLPTNLSTFEGQQNFTNRFNQASKDLPLSGVFKTVGNYGINRFAAPLAQVPNAAASAHDNLKQVFAPKQTIGQRAGNLANAGINTLRVAGGLTPIDDPLWTGIDFIKGANRADNRGKGLIANLKSGVQSASLEKPTGLGETLFKDPTLQDVGNLVELPLMIASGRVAGKRAAANHPTLKLIKENMDDAIDALKISKLQNSRLYNKNIKPGDVIDDWTMFDKKLQKIAPDLYNDKGLQKLKLEDPKRYFEATRLELMDRMEAINPGLLGLNMRSTRSTKKNAQPTDILSPAQTTTAPQKSARLATQRKGALGLETQPTSPNPLSSEPVPSQVLKSAGKTTQSKLKSSQSPLEPNLSRPTTEASPINVNRLDLDDTQKARVLDTQVKELRDVLGDKEVVRIAQGAGIDTKTHTIDQTARKIAEQLNVRRQVVELENKRTQLLNSGGTEEELAAITRQIAETSRISREQGTDIARQLSARRIIANEINTPMQRVFMLLDKAGVNPDVYVKEATKIDFNNGNQVVDFYRKFAPASTSNWLDLVRYNSMLSSPNTHINNFFSNLQGSVLVAPIEKTITGSLDALKSALTGSKRQYYAGEGMAYAKGYLSSVGKAVENFSNVMKGKNLIANPDYKDIPLTQSGSNWRRVENSLKQPMSLLEAADQLFTALTRGGVNESLNYRASKSGKSIPNADILADAEAAKRLFRSDLGDNQGSNLLNAIDALGNTIQGLKSHKNPIVSTIARFSLPFVRTPTNVLKQGVEYSPLGLGTMWGARNKTEQLSKAIMGSSIGISAAMLLGSDRLTFAEPTGEKQKAAFRAAGMQPYSVKIGDKWLSYSKLHPAIAFNLALVAAVKNAEDTGSLNQSQADTVLKGLSKWMNFFADQSYVKSIGDLVSATKGDVESPARLVGNYAQQLVPYRALMGWVARIVDPYQRKVDPDGSILDKQLQQLATQIPFISKTVPARLGPTGEPIENQNRFINALSPVKVTTENPENKQIFDLLQEQSKLDKTKTKMKKQLQREINQGKATNPFVDEAQAAEEMPTSTIRLDPKQQIELSIAKDKQKLTGEDQTYMNYMIFTDSNGKQKTVDLGRIQNPPTKPEKTGNKELDKQLMSDYKGELTSIKNDITELYKAGKIDKDTAAAALDEIEATYKSASGSGGISQATINKIISQLNQVNNDIAEIMKPTKTKRTSNVSTLEKLLAQSRSQKTTSPTDLNDIFASASKKIRNLRVS
jgi:hypothetical protein